MVSIYHSSAGRHQFIYEDLNVQASVKSTQKSQHGNSHRLFRKVLKDGSVENFPYKELLRDSMRLRLQFEQDTSLIYNFPTSIIFPLIQMRQSYLKRSTYFLGNRCDRTPQERNSDCRKR